MNSSTVAAISPLTTPTVEGTSVTPTPPSSIVKPNNVNGKVKVSVPFSYAYGSVCLLCLRTKTCTSVKSDLEKHRQSRLTCVKYVALVSRYLKLDTELTKISQKTFFNPAFNQLKDGGDGGNDDNGNDIDFKEEISKFIICDLCLPLAESFCKTYQEYELIRVKLEAKIWESVTLVEKSEGMGDSLRVVKGIKRGGGVKVSVESTCEDVLMSFRKMLKTHGPNFIKHKEPRLLLKRNKKAEELVRSKIPKLIKNGSPVVSTAQSTETESASNPNPGGEVKVKVTIKSPQSNPDVKIVRRPPGKHPETSDVTIIRVPTETSTKSENKNEITANDVIRKKNEDVTSHTPTVSTNVSVGVGIPNSGPQHDNTLLPVSTILLNGNIFNPSVTTFVPILQSQYGAVSKSSKMVSVPIQIQKCNISGCGLTFPKTEQGLMDIQSHLNTHRGLPCMKCTAVLRTPFELISHELKHDEINPNIKAKQGFQCTRCPHYSMLRTEHQEHFLEMHLNSKIELLKCRVCKKGFSSSKQQQYRTHIATCHPNEQKDDISVCHSCMICRVHFKKKATLWKHLKNDHRISCRNGPHKCPDCSESFFFEYLMNLHRQFSCEYRQSHKCPYPGCFSSFGETELVKQHVESVHKDDNFLLPECPICKMKFYELSTLRSHVMTHNGEQVKLVFTDGSNQEAQVIPVNEEEMSRIATANAASPLSDLPESAVSQGSSTCAFIPSPIAPPESPSTPPPMIVSVTGASQNADRDNNFGTTAAFANNPINNIPTNHGQPVQVVQAEVDTKLFDHFFDESNDSEEHLMEFIQNNLNGVHANGGEDEIPPPDEDPFAWLLAENFEDC